MAWFCFCFFAAAVSVIVGFYNLVLGLFLCLWYFCVLYWFSQAAKSYFFSQINGILKILNQEKWELSSSNFFLYIPLSEFIFHPSPSSSVELQ